MRRTVNIFIVAMCVAVPALAQNPAPVPPVPPAMQAAPAPPSMAAPRAAMPAPPPMTGQRATTPAPTPPAQAVAAPHAVDPRFDQSDVNIKLTVKITDTNSGNTQTKVVSLIMANRGGVGRVRSAGDSLVKDTVLAGGGGTPTTSYRNRSSELNVDAQVQLFKSGVISTFLTISYTPEWTDETSKMTNVSQTVGMFLKDGVPTVITQAADPTKGSRSVSIEVTAAVMK